MEVAVERTGVVDTGLADPDSNRLRVQDNRPATVQIAAHSDEYSSRWSTTNRIAFSRTSAGYLFDMNITLPTGKVCIKPGMV